MNVNIIRTVAVGMTMILGACVTSGCAASTQGTPTSEQSSEAPLSTDSALNRSYVTTAATQGKQSIDWLATDPLVLDIRSSESGAQILVHGPCNALTYSVEAESESPLTWRIVGTPAMTYMQCLDDRGENEEWLLSLLGAADARVTQTEASLQLRSGTAVVTANKCGAAPGGSEDPSETCPTPKPE